MTTKIVQKPDYSSYNLEDEKKKLTSFLNSQNLVTSPDFFNQIEVGDIIEVYSFPENKQIYSNSEFKKLCSYTDEQMTTIPFPQLFWRDNDVHAGLMKRAAEVCNSVKNTYAWNIPRHELIESLHPRKRTFEMAVKKISPCFKGSESQSSAFISTLQVEFIFEWNIDIG